MKTWLITGVSSGFGRALAELALSRGDRVIGTVRQESAYEASDALRAGRFFRFALDVSNNDRPAHVVTEIEERIGPIDILVNNAGYGYEGTIEEAAMRDVQRQFDVNVFGPIRMIQAVLPYFRARRRGHVINITSVGGLAAFSCTGIYSASKFALEGISEALSMEMASFGINVTAVEPGSFRTDFAGRSLVRGAMTIADYEPILAPQRKARADRSGKQQGDPAKAAEAIFAIGGIDNPPGNLLLGTDAVAAVRAKLTRLLADIETWEKVSAGTDFPK